MDKQQRIENLIKFIAQAEDPGVVTGQIVADVLDHLNQLYKDALSGVDGVAEEKAERRAADQRLTELINDLSTIAGQAYAKSNANAGRLDVLLDGASATKAIDTFKEVVAFLEGLENDKTLAGTLNTLRESIPEQRVLPFGSVIEGEAPMVTAGTITNLVSGTVHFVAATKCFVFLSGFGPSAKYYGNWPGADAYGPANHTSGRTPSVGKLYVSATKGVYLWDGTEFADVNAPLAEALDTRLGGMSLRVISAEEDERMTEEETHDPDTIYLIPEEDD